MADPGEHRDLGGLRLGVLPELREIVGEGSRRRDLVGVEADVGHACISLSFIRYADIDRRETGNLPARHLDAGDTVLVGRDAAALFGLQFFGAVAVLDFRQRHPYIFLDGVEGELGRLAAGIDPVGVIRFGIDGDVLF